MTRIDRFIFWTYAERIGLFETMWLGNAGEAV